MVHVGPAHGLYYWTFVVASSWLKTVVGLLGWHGCILEGDVWWHITAKNGKQKWLLTHQILLRVPLLHSHTVFLWLKFFLRCAVVTCLALRGRCQIWPLYPWIWLVTSTPLDVSEHALENNKAQPCTSDSLQLLSKRITMHVMNKCRIIRCSEP